MGTLCLEVERFTETPSDFLLESDPAWWEAARQTLQHPEVSLLSPVVLELRGHRIGHRLLVQGAFQGTLELLCGRCLEPYGYAFCEGIQLLLEPAPSRAGLEEGEIRLDPDDQEVGRYTGDRLEFGPVVLELLALAWPVQPCCGDACRGLCPVCGGNRNRSVCSCEPEARARPFARLAEMLKGSRQGG